ncbi:TIGR03086 family metal-binding protein [Actinocatenispora sera]|uniref:TIGR03086 family metal-binding protein n=1 Tax=Actinocatenispora sera TaxID=390989 RepID=UPI0033D04FC2
MIDLKPAGEQVALLVGAVRDEQLGTATPCSEYDLGAVIGHVDEVSQGFARLARKRVDADDPAAPTRFDDGWRQRVAAHVRDLGAAWDEPGAWQGSTDVGTELPNETWGRIALTELVVHGWDIARAAGLPWELPEATLRACLAHVEVFVPAAPVPQLWGPRQPVADDAPLIDRIVAITGRAPQYGQRAAGD